MKLQALLITAVALLFCAAASATTVLQLDFPELIRASDAIVVGSVKSVEAKIENGKVYTHVRVEVVESLKGDPSDDLEIVHIGGRTKRLVTMVHGMPSFREGERALLFLEQPTAVKHFVVTGLAQGKVDLAQDVSGEWYAPKKLVDPSAAKPIKMPSGDVELQRAGPATVQIEKQGLNALRTRIAEELSRVESGEVTDEATVE